MEQTPRTEELMVTCLRQAKRGRQACYRCGQPILLGQGRYNVFPRHTFCSWRCLQQTLPDIADAIARFVKEPRQVRGWLRVPEGTAGGKNGFRIESKETLGL